MTSRVDFNPTMCNCPNFDHHCVDREDDFLKGDSNFDAIPAELIREIGGFLVTRTINVPQNLRNFEEQSSYVRQSLLPITAPMRECEDARKWDKFKKRVVKVIKRERVPLVLFAAGVALGGLLTVKTAEITSLINGNGLLNDLLALGMAPAINDGLIFGPRWAISRYLDTVKRVFSPTGHSLPLRIIVPVISTVAISKLFDAPIDYQISLFITYKITILAGIILGGTISEGLYKINTRRIKTRPLLSGLQVSTLASLVYFIWNRCFG